SGRRRTTRRMRAGALSSVDVVGRRWRLGRIERFGRLVVEARGSGAARAGLVLRPVLARIGIFLRVDRPVGAARRSVPRRAVPTGLERLLVGALVRGRARRGRGRWPARRRGTTGPTPGRGWSTGPGSGGVGPARTGAGCTAGCPAPGSAPIRSFAGRSGPRTRAGRTGARRSTAVGSA